MTLRERLEAVAQTYLRQIEIRCGHHECCRCHINPLFLDALVQAVEEDSPKPSQPPELPVHSHHWHLEPAGTSALSMSRCCKCGEVRLGCPDA